MTTIRSASRSASSRYWVVSRIVVPPSTSSRDELPHRRAGCAGRARWSARPGTAPAGGRSARRRCRAGGACRRSRSWPGGRPRRSRSNRSSSSPARCRASRLAASRYSRPTISRFSKPVRYSSTAAYWPVSPIVARTSSASRTTSSPATSARPASATSSVVRIAHDGGLPGAVGPEQPEHRALGHGQVHAVEGGGRAEALHQALDDDRVGHAGHARAGYRQFRDVPAEAGRCAGHPCRRRPRPAPGVIGRRVRDEAGRELPFPRQVVVHSLG